MVKDVRQPVPLPGLFARWRDQHTRRHEVCVEAAGTGRCRAEEIDQTLEMLQAHLELFMVFIIPENYIAIVNPYEMIRLELQSSGRNVLQFFLRKRRASRSSVV